MIRGSPRLSRLVRRRLSAGVYRRRCSSSPARRRMRTLRSRMFPLLFLSQLHMSQSAPRANMQPPYWPFLLLPIRLIDLRLLQVQRFPSPVRPRTRKTTKKGRSTSRAMRYPPVVKLRLCLVSVNLSTPVIRSVWAVHVGGDLRTARRGQVPQAIARRKGTASQLPPDRVGTRIRRASPSRRILPIPLWRLLDRRIFLHRRLRFHLEDGGRRLLVRSSRRSPPRRKMCPRLARRLRGKD